MANNVFSIPDSRYGARDDQTLRTAGLEYTLNYIHSQGSTYGYGSRDTTIDRYSLTSDGNGTSIGGLSGSRYATAGQSSSDYGYASGGNTSTPAQSDTIDRFPFASSPAGTATDVGNLTQARDYPAGAYSKEYGYTISGAPSPSIGANSNIIDKFPFSTPFATASDVGDLVIARAFTKGGISSGYNGYVAGGSVPPLTYTNSIERFPFASDTNATDLANLTSIKQDPSGTQSATSGVVAGGITPTYTDVVESFPFAAPFTTASDVGNLTTGKSLGAPASSRSHGYFAGGRVPSVPFGVSTDVIEKFPSSSGFTTATSVGTLSISSAFLSGQQY